MAIKKRSNPGAISRFASSINDRIKEQDMYGKAISFNYRGQDTF